MAMKILLIGLSLFLYVYGDYNSHCDGVYYRNECHDFQVLIADINKPYSLVFEYKRNLLYFTYETHIGHSIWTTTGRLNLRTPSFEPIYNSHTQTVNRRTGDVYLGGCSGIYKISGPGHNKVDDEKKMYVLDTVSYMSIFNQSCVHSLFYKDALYYIEFPSMSIYIVDDGGESSIFEDLRDTKVHSFIIDNNDMMFYSNASGLYIQKLGTPTSHANLITADPPSHIKCLTLDALGDVYVCLEKSVYKVNVEAFQLRQILKIYEPYFGVAFDVYNRLVYSNATHILRLDSKKDKNDKSIDRVNKWFYQSPWQRH